MVRHLTLLLVLAAWMPGCDQKPQASEEDYVKAIQALGGQVTRDDSLPGQPVVAVAFNVNPDRFGDSCVKDLKHLKCLRELVLTGTHVTDEALKDVKELKSLRVLALGQTRITDAGLKDLQGLAGLEQLYLGSTAITDAGLKELNAFPACSTSISVARRSRTPA